MKKKKTAVALVAAVSVACSFALAACGNDDSGSPKEPNDPNKPSYTVDTYSGVASSAQYDDEATAARAFFDAELMGEYVSYKVLSPLAKDKLDALELADAADVQSASVIEISYKNNILDNMYYTSSVRADEASDTSTHKAYSIKYKDGKYKYYSPLPEVGESLTYSYVESLLDADKYKNCTLAVSTEEEDFYDHRDEATGDWVYEPIFDKTAITVKIGSAAIEEVASNKRYDNTDKNNRVEISAAEDTTYIVMRDGVSYRAIKGVEQDAGEEEAFYAFVDTFLDGQDESWDEVVSYTLSGYTGMRIISDVFTCVTKTATGFAVDSEVLAMMADGEPDEIYWTFDVKDGRIVKSEQYYDYSGTDETDDISMKQTATLSEFGTTQVPTVPADYLAMIDEYIQDNQPPVGDMPDINKLL